MMGWLRLSRPALWSLLNNSGLDGRGLYVGLCLNPDCRCRRLLPKSRRLPFSGFLPFKVSSPAVGDTLRSSCCRCVWCRGSQIDHGHLALNCSIKIIMPAVKASVISYISGPSSIWIRLHLWWQKCQKQFYRGHGYFQKAKKTYFSRLFELHYSSN